MPSSVHGYDWAMLFDALVVLEDKISPWEIQRKPVNRREAQKIANTALTRVFLVVNQYHIIRLNCKHFAEYCVDKTAVSTQAQELFKNATGSTFGSGYWISFGAIPSNLVGRMVSVPAMFARQSRATGAVLAPNTPAEHISGATETMDPQSSSDDLEIVDCCVCLDNICSVRFLPCNHIAMCEECRPRVRRCPLCRSEIADTERVL